jgi:hypothetical protein
MLTLVALLLSGQVLDAIWRLNPEAHATFMRMADWAPVLMFAVAIACALAAIGLWQGARWGHRLPLGLLTVNLIGDTQNAILRHDLRTLIGLPIAGALIAYLLTSSVRSQFGRVKGAAG